MTAPEPMTQERLAAIKERCEKADTGPWEDYEDTSGAMPGLRAIKIPSCLADKCMAHHFPNNSTFIAHARTDIPDLIAALEASWAEVEKLQAKLERCQMFAETWKDQVTVYKDEVSRLQKEYSQLHRLYLKQQDEINQFEQLYSYTNTAKIEQLETEIKNLQKIIEDAKADLKAERGY